MMRSIFVWTFIVILALTPTAAAEGDDPPGVLLGDEELPEIPDAADDVQYDPKYVGPTDHAYLDFLAGWFAYSNTTDEIQIIFKTADGAQIQTAPREWTIACSMGGNITVDSEITGRLNVGWIRNDDGTPMKASVTFTPGSNSGFREYDSRIVDHRFQAVLEAPGLFEFAIPRATLLLLGNQIESLSAGCLEYSATPPPLILPLMSNRDPATSGAAYSFTDHRRIRSADGATDPLDLATAEPTPEATASESPSTPTPGLSVLVLAFAAALVLVRVRRRPL